MIQPVDLELAMEMAKTPEGKSKLAYAHGLSVYNPDATPPAPFDECPEPECSICGIIACAYDEPFHFHHDGCPAEAAIEGMVGLRVFHRRADMFGVVKVIQGKLAFVKYEWPYDPAADAVEVPVSELRPA